MKDGENEAFNLVNETCSKVDAALNSIEKNVKAALSDADTIIKGQTQALREALIEKCAECDDLIVANNDLEDKLTTLRKVISDLESTIDVLNLNLSESLTINANGNWNRF